MPIAANDIVRVRLNGRIHGQRTINILHFRALSGGPTLLQLLLTAVIECVVQLMATSISQEWNHEGATATTLTGDFDEITDTTESGSGSLLTDALPSFCSGVIRFHTATRGRTGRGRMYVPGITETLHTDSKWDNPDTVLGEFLNCLLQKFVGIGGNPQTVPEWRLVILSRKELQSNGGNFLAAARDVVGGSVNHDVCTTRSRKLRAGD